MADKKINELPSAETMSDNALLAVWQEEETRRIAGAVLRAFSESAAADEISKRFAAMTIRTGEPGTDAIYDPVTNTMTIPRGETGKSGSGSGDMQAEIYDPRGKAQDVFKYAEDEAAAAKPFVQQIALPASGWSERTQTVYVYGISANEGEQVITATPDAEFQTAYYAAGIKATSQSQNGLTFTADVVPSVNLLVYVIVQEVRA